MTLPTILLAFLIAILYGTLYHLARGGGVWRLLFYIGLSILGFTIGQIVGMWRGWLFLMLGAINLGLGTLGSAILLGLGDWLSRIEAKRQSGV